MAGDQDAVSTGRASLAGQPGTDVAGVSGGGGIERQNFEPAGKTLDLAPVLDSSHRFDRSVWEFGRRDRRSNTAPYSQSRHLNHHTGSSVLTTISASANG